MMELAVFAAVALMIAAALTKGYTVKSLTQLRLDGGRLHHEEVSKRQDLMQAEVLQESADALRNQAEYDCRKFTDELANLAVELKKVADDLGRSEEEEQQEE
jgi:hypothetical protein